VRNAFSLAITLWISAALLAGAIYFIKINKENLSITSTLSDKLSVQIEQDNTLELIKYYSMLSSFEFNRLKLPNNAFVKYIPLDNTPFRYKNSIIKVQDIGGIVNANYMGAEAIKYLYGTKDYLVAKDSLADWLDKNDFYRINGAESQYYIDKNCNYTPRNNGFIYYKDELNDIRGFSNISKMIDFEFIKYYYLNIYTMSEIALSINFNISKSDAKLLVKKREKDIKEFYKLFNIIDKEVMYDENIILDAYSYILRINIKTSIKQASKEKTVIIDLHKKPVILYIY